MDVSIRFEHPTTTFTNGDLVCGHVVIYCPSTTIVSKITASLTGESMLNLVGNNSLFGSWEQGEKHRFLHNSQVILPQRIDDGQKKQSIRLEFGYHSYWFGLRIPDSPNCCSCPPNSPVFLSGIEKTRSRTGDFPPLLRNVIRGVDVSYRVDVNVTTMRSVFKSTTKKSLPISIWPLDPQLPLTCLPLNAFSCTNSITAKILGPPTRLPPNNTTHTPKDPYLISTSHETANLKITAHLLPDYTLTHIRAIAMRLNVKQLNSTSQNLYLQSFQMLLFGYTDIKIGTSLRTEMSCSTIVSRSNLDLRICTANSDTGMEYEIDPSLWNGKQLTSDVVPSFESCGLARRYEMEILMGFQCRGEQDGRVLFVQLRTPVRISSGIYPDRELNTLKEMDMRDVLSNGLHGHHTSAYNEVANGFSYQVRENSPEYEEEMPPTPPTYNEAIRVGMREALKKEMGFTAGQW